MDRQRIMVVGAAYMMEREMAMVMPKYMQEDRELEYMPNEVRVMGEGEGGRGEEGQGGVVIHLVSLLEGESTF